MAATDEQLLVAARSDPAAFEKFYRRRVGTVVRFAARRASSPGEVLDLVAAVWLQVVVSVDRFDETKGTAAAWLLGIAAHLCATEARRKAAEAAAVQRLGGQRILEHDDYERLEQEIAAAAIARDFLSAVADLPAAEREVAELTLVDRFASSGTAWIVGPSTCLRRRSVSRGTPRSDSARGWVLQRVFSHDVYHCAELNQALGLAGLPQIDLWA